MLSPQEATVEQKRSADEWRDVFKLWETNRLSRVEFCRTQKLPVSTFDYWRKKLGATAERTPSFVKIPTITAAVDSSTSIRIVIDDGFSVELSHGFAAEDLSTVLQAIGLNSCS
jgi:hypothetical protein